MASKEVTGKTEDEIEELRQQFEERHGDSQEYGDFEEHYCLAEIPRQPDDYDGPVRYCTLNRDLIETKHTIKCKHHGQKGDPDNLEKLARMKHGMQATREHLVEDFDDKDQALYDWIVETYPDSYGINVEEDPSAAYDLHRLAAEIVRAERGRGFLIDEGEVNEKEIRNDEGRVVINDGEVVTEKSEHYLAQMMHRQDKKITQLEKELGISRKERLRHDQTDDAVDAVKSFTELGAAFLSRDDKDFDPESEPWKEDDN